MNYLKLLYFYFFSIFQITIIFLKIAMLLAKVPKLVYTCVYEKFYIKNTELHQIVTSFQSSEALVFLFTLFCHIKFTSPKFPDFK